MEEEKMNKFLIVGALCLGLGCSTEVKDMPYEGDNHPFRVAMRDMKTPYKTLESFATDAKLLPQAAKAAQELKVISLSTAKMKPAYLTPEQHADYEKHFNDLVAVIDAHEASFKNGDVKKAQGLHAALEVVKKAAHKQFIKQAKKHRGAE
jgi:soluble cytochrome b562